MALGLSVSLGALAAAQLVVGLALQFTVLVVVGAGPQTDAYVAAQTVPMLMLGIFVTPLQNMWLTRLAVLSSDVAAWRRAHGVAQGQLLLLIGIAALVLAASSTWWLRWIFPGFSAAQTELALEITGVLLAATLLYGQSLMMTAALRARDRFVAPELVTLVVSAAAVAATFAVVPHYGVLGAAWVNLLRSALVAAILYVLAERPSFAVLSALREPEIWGQARLLLTGSTVYKCDPLIDRYWGSHAPAGGLTILTLSQTGIGAVAQILERSVCMPRLPELARLAQAREFEQMRRLYRSCIFRVAGFVVLFGSLLLIAYPVWHDAMNAVFKMPRDVAQQMWLVCLLLLGFLQVSATGGVPVSAFYALGDTKTPVRAGLIGFVVGAVLKSVGFIGYGLPGLALATSAYYLGNLVVVSLLLERRLDNDVASQRD